MSTNTLTERYVHEVVRRIPADQRTDVADELRTTIADTIEARESADEQEAEREVIAEMGDPIRLAARYADRPLALIGPELYPAYVRLMVMLLSIVLPVVTAVIVVIDILENHTFGSAVGAGIGAVLTVGGQMIAWVTVTFALIERSRSRDDVAKTTGTWTPDDLPELRQQSDKGTASVCASLVWNALLIGLIVWQHIAKPFQTDGGDRLAVLAPALWSGWIWVIIAGLAGHLALELVRLWVRRWTIPMAIGYAVAEAAFALPLAWILYKREFFNPDFLASFNPDWMIPDAFYTVTVITVLVVGVVETVRRFREALR